MKIKMFSDTICGWCYIGKLRLVKALKELNLDTSMVTHEPFQLNPQMPMNGMDRKKYITEKFGSKESANQIYSNMQNHANEEGLSFNWDKVKVTPNTTKSHILIDLGQEVGKQNQMIEEIFNAYFIRGENIGEDEVLLAIAKKFNLEEEKVKESMNDSKLQKKILEKDTRAKQLGITGVPFFVINDKYTLSGAYPVEQIKSAIERSNS